MINRIRLFIIIILLVLLSICTRAYKNETIMAPMRDGVKLATDLYFPEGSDGPWPLILIRTPNYRERYDRFGNYFSNHGYVVAIQDVRGQNASEGEFEIWVHDKDDGYDAIEWLARQEWCNGKVGMAGGSYNAWAQMAAATTKPPHLLTIAPIVTMGDPSIHHVYPFGTYALTQQLNVISQFKTRFGSGGDRFKLEPGFQKDLMDLPVIDLDKKLFGIESPWWRKHILHKPHDPYWEKSNVLKGLEHIDIPAFIIGGWFDFGGIGTKLAYQHLRMSANDHIKLLIGPWMHQTIGSSRFQGYDFGPKAAVDYMQELLRWYDHHLKGIENGIMEEPLVKVFAVDKNEWLEANSYPLPESQDLTLYLGGSGKLESSLPTTVDQEFTAYQYDPGNPTPSVWYDNIPEHNKIISGRKDMLIFESEPFTMDVQVAGPVHAKLYASTSGKETDWFFYYMVLDEADEMQTLGRGLIRSRYRNGRSELLKPGNIYPYDIDLWHSSFVIHKGWKLRVIICSSAFPHYSRNLNTGLDNETSTEYQTAEQKVFHSTAYPSSISFSSIPD